MQTQTITIDQFVTDNRISITADRTDSNPSNPDWNDADHWKCLLVRREPVQFTLRGRSSNASPRIVSRLTVYFSKGYGHHCQPPTAAEVLNCLALDASGFENSRSFEEWCSEYGYDSDSRKAEHIYKTVEKQQKRLRDFLGQDAYDTLLWGTESL